MGNYTILSSLFEEIVRNKFPYYLQQYMEKHSTYARLSRHTCFYVTYNIHRSKIDNIHVRQHFYVVYNDYMDLTNKMRNEPITQCYFKFQS